MNDQLINSLLRLLEGGKDDAMLRFGLGQALLGAGRAAEAATQLAAAVAHDPEFSAAWKLLGRARLEDADQAGARVAWERGLDVARRRGDRQAEKEMAVFLRRLEKEGS